MGTAQKVERSFSRLECQSTTLRNKIKIPGKDSVLQDFKEVSKYPDEDGFDDKSSNGAQAGYLSILNRNYSKLLPIVKEIYRCCVREDGEEQENVDMRDYDLDSTDCIDLKNLVGFFNQSLYHEYLNITNIMKLKRLDFRDIYGIRSIDLTLTRENILERLMLLITSYFCMGTELRFLRQMCVDGFESTIDAEYWHGKALEIAVKFLPGDSPLTKHIVSSYAKHHSPSYEQIPEDEEVASALKIIKPFKGLYSNRMSPIIKCIGSPSVKLSPLDLAPNDYIGSLIDKTEINILKSHIISQANPSTQTLQKQSTEGSNVNSCRVEPEGSSKDKISTRNSKELLSSTSSSCLIQTSQNPEAQPDQQIPSKAKPINIQENSQSDTAAPAENPEVTEQPKSTRPGGNSSRENRSPPKAAGVSYTLTQVLKRNFKQNNEILISEDATVGEMMRPKTSQVATRIQLVKSATDEKSKDLKTLQVSTEMSTSDNQSVQASKNRCTSTMEKSRNLTPFGNRTGGASTFENYSLNTMQFQGNF